MSNVPIEPKRKPERKEKKFFVPHTYAIIFIIIVIAAIATYIVPSGEFERAENDAGRTVVVDGTYQHVEPNPVGFFDVFKAIPKGMVSGASIIFYIFLVGGAFGIIRATGAIEAGVNSVVSRLEGREKMMIPVSMLLFSIGGFSFGMAEESIIFVPIGIAIARSMGFDAVTGTAMISLGAASGFIGGMLNPFTVGVAQSIAEVPIYSGIGFRAVVYVFVLLFGMWYVTRYAMKVKKDPTKSVVYDIEQKWKQDEQALLVNNISELKKNHYLVFIIFMGGLIFNVYGVFKWGWYLTELTASFIVIGILSGIVGKLSINKIFDSFVNGAKLLTFGALIVGFARAILVVLEEGRIIDTLIFSLASTINHLPNTINILGMFIGQAFLNVFIPSGSGQAATTMPLMAPIADLVGITRQQAVLAYQYGDAITNSIIPTSAALMGYLAVAGIPYERWVKFIWKLILGWVAIAAIALIVAVMIGVS